MDIYTIDCHVKGKIITLDESTLPPEWPVGDNTGYYIRFVFEDDVWSPYTLKTARFIHEGEYDDVLFEGDTCEIPLSILKGGLIDVGLFAGSLKTTTVARITIKPSVLDKDGPPADPPPEVYAQLVKMVTEIRDNPVSDEKIAEAVRQHMETNPPISITTITQSDIEGS